MTRPQTVAPFLIEIGRGRDDARAFSAAASRDAKAELLDAAASDLEVGALAIGKRMKGETLAEFVGFMLALHERLHPGVAWLHGLAQPEVSGPPRGVATAS